MPNQTKLQTLEQKIAKSRQKMMDLWDDRGHTDPEILAASIELDRLLNIYQKLLSQTKP